MPAKQDYRNSFYNQNLIEEGTIFIKRWLLPYIRQTWLWQFKKCIALGLSGSAIYAEADESSDIDIIVMINDLLCRNITISCMDLEDEIKSKINRVVFPHVDVGVVKISYLGINSLEADEIVITEKFLEGGFIVKTFRPVIEIGGWIEQLQSELKKALERISEDKDRLMAHFWVMSALNFMTNIKPMMKRKPFVYESFFGRVVIDLIKFLYLLNNEFIPPIKCFYDHLSGLHSGAFAADYIKKIKQNPNPKKRAEYYESLILRIAEELLFPSGGKARDYGLDDNSKTRYLKKAIVHYLFR